MANYGYSVPAVEKQAHIFISGDCDVPENDKRYTINGLKSRGFPDVRSQGRLGISRTKFLG